MLQAPRPHIRWSSIVLLGIAAVLLTVWQHRAQDQRVTSLPERIVIAMGRPLQYVFTAVSAWPRDLTLGLVRAHQIVQENESLRQQLADKQAQVTQSIQYYLENKALLESLGLPSQQSQTRTAARVIGLDLGPRRCRAILQLPKPGLAGEGDIVAQHQGLVGRILKVQGRTAEVMLLIDSLSAVAGRDTRSRDEDLGMGIVYPEGGFSSPALRLKMEKLRPLADLREGDLVVTSGLDAVYPRGLPIGTIEQVVRSPANAESVTAIIKPAVDFFRLEYVYVVKQR